MLLEGRHPVADYCDSVTTPSHAEEFRVAVFTPTGSGSAVSCLAALEAERSHDGESEGSIERPEGMDARRKRPTT